MPYDVFFRGGEGGAVAQIKVYSEYFDLVGMLPKTGAVKSTSQTSQTPTGSVVGGEKMLPSVGNVCTRCVSWWLLLLPFPPNFGIGLVLFIGQWVRAANHTHVPGMRW